MSFNLYIAHRGIHNKKHPENTLGAIKNAMLNNIAVEIDVQLTKDNIAIVFHDKNLYRLTKTNKELKQVNFNEIQDLFVESSKEKIPKLEDVLNLVKGKVMLDIEIKYYNKPLKTIKIIKKVLEGYKGDYMIKSFNPLISFCYKLLNKNVKVGVLAKRVNNNIPVIFKKLINNFFYLHFYKPDFIVYNIEDINLKIVNKLKKHNIPLYLYTIDSVEKLEIAKNYTNVIVYENFEKKRLDK